MRRYGSARFFASNRHADVSHDALTTGAAARSRRRSPGSVRGAMACQSSTPPAPTSAPPSVLTGQAKRMTVDDLMTLREIDSRDRTYACGATGSDREQRPRSSS